MTISILVGDCREVLRTLPEKSVHMCVTSPPYMGLRSYLPDGHPDKAKEMGSEATPEEFVAALVEVFAEVRRVLRDDGTLWLNLGDSYAAQGGGQVAQTKWQIDGASATQNEGKSRAAPNGLKPKDLIGAPWRVAFALQANGWYLRSAMPWVKRGVMPESATDRPGSAVEYVFMLTKKPRYFWDADAVKMRGAIAAGTRAAKGSDVRSELKDVNGRPPEYWDYTGERNFRNSDLFYSSLDQPFGLVMDGDGTPIALDVNPEPFPGAHFAAYPTKLIRPLILGATSERGCCAACGAPWVRQTERSVRFDSGSGRAGNKPTGKGAGGDQTESGSYDVRMGPVVTSKTTGWSAGCKCAGGNTVLCTILDPFAGAFTSLLVADRLGRNGIGIELNPEYAEMGRKRLERDAGLFAEVAVRNHT